MVQSCCAYNCTERASGNTSYAFHRFPLNNESLLKEWCMALRRKDFQPQKHSRICSKHFTEDSYKPGFKFRKLKRNAKPTIFDFRKSNQDHGKSTFKTKKRVIAAAASYKRYISSKQKPGYLRDDEKIGNVNSTSENEVDQREIVVEIIKLENYENDEQMQEYNTDSDISNDCGKDYVGGSESCSSETISNNDKIVQLNVTSNISHQKQIEKLKIAFETIANSEDFVQLPVSSDICQQKQSENEKLRQIILLLHKRMEKFMFLVDCLQTTNMISEEAAIVLRSTMDM